MTSPAPCRNSSIGWLANSPGVPPESVRDIVNASWQEFTGRPIRAFVPVLAERSGVNSCAARLPRMGAVGLCESVPEVRMIGGGRRALPQRPGS